MLLSTISAFGQIPDSLYVEAGNYGKKYSAKYFNYYSEIHPIDTLQFWSLIKTRSGNEFFIIDADAQNLSPAFNQQRLTDSLSVVLKKEIKSGELPFRDIRFENKKENLVFTIDDTIYTYRLSDYRCIKSEKKRTEQPSHYWGNVNREAVQRRTPSPDGKKEAYISEGNLWVRDLENKKTKKLSFDGSVYDYYSSDIYWSPDGEKIISCKYRPAETRQLTMIVSSPKNQLQPTKEAFDYIKPGDALPIRKPVVFFVNEERQLSFDIPNLADQYDLGRIRWEKNSRFFSFEFNKRGHQQYIVYMADVEKEELKALVNEESATFVYYNALFRHWFEKSEELLWISERDGWRHLYLYDKTNGKAKQLTKGEWIVKSIVRVDEDNRAILFKGCGVDKGEDPYLEKYYVLNIDNGKINCLTPENANHNVVFSSDYKYLVDTYSRVDAAPVVVVRSLVDKKYYFKPNIQADLTETLQAGYKMPEVFSAKGRDGKTDIWGIIMRPSNFDPKKKYPVIEYIYAGPHDSFVPKSFSISKWGAEMLELGFIVVQIDGMGTANRSKAFHDVCWKNLKDAGFPDRIAWMKAAAKKFPEMDIDRVGIYGCSAGGQSAMGALLFHPEFYKVAYAACGCHDNRMDKMWWNEQWMGYPIGKEYEESSNVVNAHKLQGKLMLVLGELDNNVDPSSTLQVVDELIKHKKEFEFVMLPNERHTMGGEYGERKRKDFFVKHLLGMESPDWNK